MKEHKRKAQVKKNYEIIPTPCLPPATQYESATLHPPCLSHPHTIHNNNTMDTQFLVQMRQSNKCGSIRNNEIFNLHLGSDSCIKNWTVLLVVLKKFVSVIYLILKRSIENCFCREPHPP